MDSPSEDQTKTKEKEMHYDEEDMKKAYNSGLWQGVFAGFGFTVLTVLAVGFYFS